MKRELYIQIVQKIKEFKGLAKDCKKWLCQIYSSVSPCTIGSILNQETQLKVKCIYYSIFRSQKEYLDIYLKAVENQAGHGIIVDLASKLNMPPSLLASKIIESFYLHKNNENLNKLRINQMLKNTNLIEDTHLAYEVFLCVLNDDVYGPISNTLSRYIGLEHEKKLQFFLKTHKITYINEENLKQKGYDKTPDCKLEIPIAVNGFVINWIESKAQFGSPNVHSKYIKEQYFSYWNRFGPGLVIYWFGFVDELVELNESKFIMMDNLPENITYMDPSSLR